MSALLLLSVASSVCAGLIGGVFFAFSVFVMRALQRLPAEQGVAAMQHINVTVITPLFLGAFLGAVPLLAVTAYMAHARAVGGEAWLWAAFAVYTLGCVGVTLRFNVPRNNRLAGMPATSDAARQYWPVYVSQWGRWNHVRCLASLLAAAACAAARAAATGP